jgi:hypothetical protein
MVLQSTSTVSGGGMGNDAVLTQIEPRHVTTRRQHADEHVDVVHTGRGAVLSHTAIHGTDQIRHQIEQFHLVAGGYQISSHWPAHVAEPNETDAGHGVFLLEVVQRIAGPRRLEMGADIAFRQRFDGPILPGRLVVLVDDQGADSLRKIRDGPRTG